VLDTVTGPVNAPFAAGIGTISEGVDEGNIDEIWAGTISTLSKARQVFGSGCSSEKRVISNSGSSSPLNGVCASKVRSTP
jgi:hypothetical protein